MSSPIKLSSFDNENIKSEFSNFSFTTSSSQQLNNSSSILSQSSIQSSPIKDSIKRPNILSRNNKTSFVNVNLSLKLDPLQMNVSNIGIIYNIELQFF